MLGLDWIWKKLGVAPPPGQEAEAREHDETVHQYKQARRREETALRRMDRLMDEFLDSARDDDDVSKR